MEIRECESHTDGRSVDHRIGADQNPPTPKLTDESEIILADQAEREAARNDLDCSFSVEAGAGTGKTTLLVERILSLIQNRPGFPGANRSDHFHRKGSGRTQSAIARGIEKALPLAPAEEGEDALAQALEDLERASISRSTPSVPVCSGSVR